MHSEEVLLALGLSFDFLDDGFPCIRSLESVQEELDVIPL